jgi:hypothetical protein
MEVMPSRPITVAIIAFWLFTAGWFVVRDIGPFGQTGDAPPYTIELSDEANRPIVPDRWTCTLNGHKIGTVRTLLAYEPRDDTFEFRAKCPEIKLLEADLPLAGRVRVLVKDYDDRVRVSREGELRAMETSAMLTVEGIGPLLAARVELSAEVRRGRLERHALLEATGIGRYAPRLESTDPPRGTVLNPMHPVPKITGLQPGKTWRQPLTDPRTDILRAAFAQLPVKVPLLPETPAVLTALVLPDQRLLDWNGPQSCFVIEYRGDEDYIARTWVRISDAAVLRQEAGAHGETVVLQRE